MSTTISSPKLGGGREQKQQRGWFRRCCCMQEAGCSLGRERQTMKLHLIEGGRGSGRKGTINFRPGKSDPSARGGLLKTTMQCRQVDDARARALMNALNDSSDCLYHWDACTFSRWTACRCCDDDAATEFAVGGIVGVVSRKEAASFSKKEFLAREAESDRTGAVSPCGGFRYD